MVLVAIAILSININTQGGIIRGFNQLLGIPSGAIETVSEDAPNYLLRAYIKGRNAITEEPVNQGFEVIEPLTASDLLVKDDSGTVYRVGSSQECQIVASQIRIERVAAIAVEVQNLVLDDEDPQEAIAVTATLKKSLRLGPNQEGLMLDILETCYNLRSITQSQAETWTKQPPNFADLQKVIEGRIENGCKESVKLKLKMAATFQYGVFSRPQPEFTEKHIRIDLSKLPPEIGAIAAESLAWQLMNQHRLLGEMEGKLPRTYLFIDEAKELKKSPACDRIIADGRKYGLGLVLASQSERHLSPDVIGNSATKIVLPVDSSEVKKVSSKFRLAEKKVAHLAPLTAICRFGKQAEFVEILPYYERIQ